MTSIILKEGVKNGPHMHQPPFSPPVLLGHLAAGGNYPALVARGSEVDAAADLEKHVQDSKGRQGQRAKAERERNVR